VEKNEDMHCQIKQDAFSAFLKECISLVKINKVTKLTLTNFSK